MRKIPANGVVFAVCAYLLYIGAAVVFLETFTPDTAIIDQNVIENDVNPIGFYLAFVIAIGGGLLLVAFLYRLDDAMQKSAPEWLFAVLALVVPYAIYWLADADWLERMTESLN